MSGREFCELCGEEIWEEDDSYCDVCDDGPFCIGCIGEHESNAHVPVCHSCGVKLEVDPPCPICHREFCEGCISTHVELCRADEEIHLGIQPTLYAFVFEDGLK